VTGAAVALAVLAGSVQVAIGIGLPAVGAELSLAK
jgi:hypothetical protein